MAKDNDSGIDNAAEIIERFGGIRPMATKMDVPVTTVQGWKKRDVIPGNRRNEVLNAAKSHDIDLSGLIAGVANENAGQPPAGHVTEGGRPGRTSEVKSHRAGSPGTADSSQGLSQEAVFSKIRDAQRQAVKHSTLITTIIIIAFSAFLGLLLWPAKEKIDYNGNEIARIKNDVNIVQGSVSEMQREQSFLESMTPSALRAQFDKIREQAEQTQQRVRNFSQQADSMISVAMDPNSGSLEERLQKIEAQLTTLGAPAGLTDFIGKIKNLQQSAEGQGQLGEAVRELGRIMQSAPLEETDLNTVIGQAREQSDALGQTMGSVPKTDLKAAAYLMAFAQFRNALNRSEPFEEDLAVMQRMVGEDNPELTAAIRRLAPKAQDGVLTAPGLSNQFKGMAGDIVVASLKGEDVSIQEKARARFNNLLKVEKDGTLLTGTETQVIVANAQTLLDQGKVSAAIAELEKLEGPAAQTAQPWITEAQMTLLANELDARLGGEFGNIVSEGNVNTGQVFQLFENMIPGRGRIVKDEESGVIILDK